MHYYIVATDWQNKKEVWTGQRFVPDSLSAKVYMFQGTAESEAHRLAGQYYAIYREVRACPADKMPW